MEVKTRKAGNATILELSGPLLVGEAEKACWDSVSEQLQSGARNLAINLAGVPYMDSSGIGALVRVFNAVRQAGGGCRLYAPTKKVRQLLKTVRLDEVLNLTDDEESALAAF